MIFVYGFLHTFRVGSVYVTLAVTFERFHAIICPLRHFRRKKYMLPFCISFAILYNIPKYFELQIEVKYKSVDGVDAIRVQPRFWMGGGGYFVETWVLREGGETRNFGRKGGGYS